MPRQALRFGHEAGLIITHDRESDRPISEVWTVQCGHCGGHIRSDDMMCAGFCHGCNKFYHGDTCAVCIPTEQLLRNIEAGRPLDFRPTQSRADCGSYRQNFSPIFGTK
jgi:hypothetical protein